MGRPVHVLGPAIDKLTGGLDELAEALLRPGIEIVARIDRKFACLAEGWAVPHARILREGRRGAWNGIVLSDVASGIGAPHVKGKRVVIRRLMLNFDHCRTSAYLDGRFWK